MHIHILGICGTFMGGIAVLARELGHTVTGSDAHVYPPMSTQLEKIGIKLCEGYDPKHLIPHPDLVIVGNAMSRGNLAVEYVMAQQLPYISGPQWLYEHVLHDRHVLAVAGTHGKTTTTSLLAWILEYAGCQPGFLIGGVAENFGISARLGKKPFFVIEADEYDTAFFDKRSKFLHYRPRTLILNNLEYDHADIFPDLDAIKRQFHFLIRTVPANGALVMPVNDIHLADVLTQGAWTPTVFTDIEKNSSCEWKAQLKAPDGSAFDVYHHDELQGTVEWPLLGKHNVANAIAAVAAARHAGVNVKHALEAMAQFRNVKRRLEIKGQERGITVYDDFAHHPTAIATTLAGLRARVGLKRILAVIDFGSYTMRAGVHKEAIASALKDADGVILAKTDDTPWDFGTIMNQLTIPGQVCTSVDEIIQSLVAQSQPDDHIVVMSNKGFGGIHTKLLSALKTG